MGNAYENGLTELISDFERQPSVPLVMLAEITRMKRKNGIYSESYVRRFTDNLIRLCKRQRKLAGERNLRLIETERCLIRLSIVMTAVI